MLLLTDVTSVSHRQFASIPLLSGSGLAGPSVGQLRQLLQAADQEGPHLYPPKKIIKCGYNI